MHRPSVAVAKIAICGSPNFEGLLGVNPLATLVGIQLNKIHM